MSVAARPIRIGVVGYGFGQHLVNTLIGHPEFQLVAVADRSNSDLPLAAERFGFTACRDATAMMADHALDAVCIATSPKSRRPLIDKSIEHNLAMMVEKPWASNAAHARELAALCARSERPVMVGFSFRFHPAIVKLKAMIDDGSLGVPRMLNGQNCFGWLPPADGWAWDPGNGNGFINENSCHLFDAVCYLMGRPVRIFAEAGRFTGKPMEDAMCLTMRFANDSIASLTVGGLGAAAAKDYPRIDLFADGGQAQLRGESHVWRELRWAMQGSTEMCGFQAEPERLSNTRYGAALTHFAACVRNGSPCQASVADGVLAVDVAMAANESARTQRPVDLPTPDEKS